MFLFFFFFFKFQSYFLQLLWSYSITCYLSVEGLGWMGTFRLQFRNYIHVIKLSLHKIFILYSSVIVYYQLFVVQNSEVKLRTGVRQSVSIAIYWSFPLAVWLSYNGVDWFLAVELSIRSMVEWVWGEKRRRPSWGVGGGAPLSRSQTS